MKQILFQSLIDIDKWNEARWTATACLHDPDGVRPPYVGLVFENADAGRSIFKDLLERIGSIDVFEELYFAIIEGEIPEEAPGYSVHVSSDPTRTEARLRSQGQDLPFDEAIVISRFQRMIPAPDSPHLSKFKSEVQAHGRYALIPVSSDVQPQFDCAIEKREIHFRQAANIGKSDRDAVVFPEKWFENESVN
ncbi:MAG TPA: hypothetical protein VG297_25860 [Bryobacteraceae bacterium]|jgi:hypothetical protein|nr:hypothetical protein [Bryobacteraceae bacterium]